MVGLPSIHESLFSTPEGRRIRDEVRELVPLIRENASAGEELGCLPPATLDALHQTGLFRASVPPDFGGYALGARDLAEIVAAVATGDGSAAWMTMIASGFARVMLTFPEGAVREVYSRSLEWPGPVVASASLFSERIQQASRVPGGYLIPSGNKWGFGSGCKHAAYIVVGIEVPAGPDSVMRAMALLEKGQYEIVDDWHVMGLRGSSSNSVRTTEEIFVPEQRVADLARMPERLDQLHEHYQGLGYQLDGRGLMLIPALETMAVTLGMAKGAFECFLEQSCRKKPFNLPYDTLAATPSVQVAAGKTHAMINAAECLLFGRADYIDRKAQAREPFTAAEESAIMMDLVHAGNVCGAAIDTLQLTLGSSTVSVHNPIQRFARDVRVALTHGSTRLDPAAEISGRHLLGQPPFTDGMAAVPGVARAAKTAQAVQAAVPVA